ncbi:DUF4255 domain-containing protein [Roseivirga sp. BDSF3-8]|uniref:DUF4255 domain-containing protein n=1 Tax=Roseivirga sp. BDSF3-8 TaxID=3241598 RepID=UPI003531BA32
MIHSALSSTADRLNEYLRNRFAQSEDKVIMSSLVNQDGSVAVTENDRIILTMVNLQQETVTQRSIAADGPNRPVNLNIFLLFSAYFSEGNYVEALKFLSAIIGFFQAHKVLNHQNTPDLDQDIDKLVFEIVNQDLQNQSHLWGMMGGKYLPSILYKVRMVTIQEGMFGGEIPNITGFGQKSLL